MTRPAKAGHAAAAQTTPITVTLTLPDAATLARLQELLRPAAAVPWAAEQGRYLARLRAWHTRYNYRRALARLEAWCARAGLEPVALTLAEADDWIAEECGELASATVNLDVTAASAFFSWLERRHPSVRNPFRGTRERPKHTPARPLIVPTPEDITTMAAAAPSQTRAAILVLACTGLRRGALPGLVVDGDVYRSVSKGRTVKGRWPAEAAAAVQAAGLDKRNPFASFTGQNVSERIRHVTQRLHAAGELAAVYSAHDLRHAFAVAHYRAHRDVYATSRALGHASVGMTAIYLRSLPGVDVDGGVR